MQAKSKITLNLTSFFQAEIEKAVKLLEENDVDEIEIPNCSGMRLVRPNTPAGQKRIEIPAMIVSIHSSGGKKYYVSQA